MPIIYLSPSTQESNMYVNGGSEEEWMNRLADAMIPYLNASGNTNLYHALKLQDKGHSPVIICITKGGANAPPFHNRSSFRIVLS